jgi:hypothetical protein
MSLLCVYSSSYNRGCDRPGYIFLLVQLRNEVGGVHLGPACQVGVVVLTGLCWGSTAQNIESCGLDEAARKNLWTGPWTFPFGSEMYGFGTRVFRAIMCIFNPLISLMSWLRFTYNVISINISFTPDLRLRPVKQAQLHLLWYSCDRSAYQIAG